jgi:hypothetical protein
MDEFQDISKLNGETFEALLRSKIQHHQNVNYLFLVSRTHILKNMFENKNIFSRDYADKYRLSTASTTQKAINVLLNEGVVEKHANLYLFADPFFKRFIIRLKA